MMKEDVANCIFCKILSGEVKANLVYQDSECSAFMDIQPVNPGHVLVIPNKHSSYLAELDDDISGHLFMIGKRLAAAIRASNIVCEGVNFFMADGEAAMQEVFHTHLHVFPRFAGDGFGLKFGENYEMKPTFEALEATAAIIRDSLATHRLYG